VTAAVLGAGLLLAVAGSAGAASAPTLAQVKKKVTQLQTRYDQLGQQYDQVLEQQKSTRQQLNVVKQEVAIDAGRFRSMQRQVAQIAVAAYEDGNLNSSLTLLTAGNPQQVLNQSSILEELSASNDAQISQFLAAARQLENTEQVARRAKAGITELGSSLKKRKAALGKLLGQEQALLSKLTPVQQVSLGGTPPTGETGTSPVKYSGPTTSQADKAIAFAYSRLGCQYVYGGTGPTCADGYDCSGLTMESWAAAGVSIPRTSYEQWDDLPHVSFADIQPGDILVFYDAGHVAIYVGHGQFIQAPHTGLDVQLVTYQGAATPGIDGVVAP
jgi:cell wall-associated NlpC family hydrolase